MLLFQQDEEFYVVRALAVGEDEVERLCTSNSQMLELEANKR